MMQVEFGDKNAGKQISRERSPRLDLVISLSWNINKDRPFSSVNVSRTNQIQS